MRVFRVDGGGGRCAIGRCDLPPDTGPSMVIPVFGPTSTIVETYAIGTVTTYPAGASGPVVERAVLLAAGQTPDLLPGWVPLHS